MSEEEEEEEGRLLYSRRKWFSLGTSLCEAGAAACAADQEVKEVDGVIWSNNATG